LGPRSCHAGDPSAREVGAGQLYLRKPELSVCSGVSVESEGCMMLSDVNETKMMVTSEAAGMARRACGDCFAVFCMLRVEACRHARDFPGLRV
jgi:hypothetical protein